MTIQVPTRRTPPVWTAWRFGHPDLDDDLSGLSVGSQGRIELPLDRRQWPGPSDRHEAHWPSDGLCLGIMVGGPVRLPTHFQVVGTPERRG